MDWGSSSAGVTDVAAVDVSDAARLVPLSVVEEMEDSLSLDSIFGIEMPLPTSDVGVSSGVSADDVFGEVDMVVATSLLTPNTGASRGFATNFSSMLRGKGRLLIRLALPIISDSSLSSLNRNMRSSPASTVSQTAPRRASRRLLTRPSPQRKISHR